MGTSPCHVLVRELGTLPSWEGLSFCVSTLSEQQKLCRPENKKLEMWKRRVYTDMYLAFLDLVRFASMCCSGFLLLLRFWGAWLNLLDIICACVQFMDSMCICWTLVYALWIGLGISWDSEIDNRLKSVEIIRSIKSINAGNSSHLMNEKFPVT